METRLTESMNSTARSMKGIRKNITSAMREATLQLHAHIDGTNTRCDTMVMCAKAYVDAVKREKKLSDAVKKSATDDISAKTTFLSGVEEQKAAAQTPAEDYEFDL